MNTCKSQFLILVVLALAVTSSGCANMSKVILAAAKDPACVEFDFLGYGTTVHFRRSFPTNVVGAPIMYQVIPTSTLRAAPFTDPNLPPVPR